MRREGKKKKKALTRHSALTEANRQPTESIRYRQSRVGLYQKAFQHQIVGGAALIPLKGFGYFTP